MKRFLILFILLAITLCIGACRGKTKDDSRQADTEDIEEIVEDTGEMEEDSDTFGDYILIYFQNGPLALAFHNNKGGGLDASGRFAIPCEYTELYYIGHDRYAVCKGEDNVTCTYGIVDLEGNEILPCEFATLGFEISDERDPCPELAGLEYFLEGYTEQESVIISAQKKKGGPVEYYSIIDGKAVDNPDKDQIMNFDYVNMEETVNYDISDTKIPDSIKDKYENVFAIPYGSYACLDCRSVQFHYYGVWNYGDGGIHIVNAEGKEIGNGQKWYEVGVEYGNGLISVRKDENGQWGLIDSEGNEVTDFNFDVWLDNA